MTIFRIKTANFPPSAHLPRSARGVLGLVVLLLALVKLPEPAPVLLPVHLAPPGPEVPAGHRGGAEPKVAVRRGAGGLMTAVGSPEPGAGIAAGHFGGSRKIKFQQ